MTATAPQASTTQLPSAPSSGAPSTKAGVADAEAALEQELRRQCSELEARLKQDPLSFENEALKVQLVQMQDDFVSLQEDFRNMREYYGQRVADTVNQLEAQKRQAGSAEGHADCLHDLLHFHEEQGRLVGSYWRAQCEKRDDSIRFLTLKLQEYTVPSAEYRKARREANATEKFVPSADGPADSVSVATAGAGHCGEGDQGLQQLVAETSGGGGSPTIGGSTTIGQAFQALTERHVELCREFREQEDENLKLERELEASELRVASLKAARAFWERAAQNGGENPLPSQSQVTSAEVASPPSASSTAAPHLAATRGYPGVAGDAASVRRKGSAEQQIGQPSDRSLTGEGQGEGAEGISSTREGSMEDGSAAALEGPVEEQCARLRREIASCEQTLALMAPRDRLPAWATRCTWRDELDVRAGQLERISLEFDKTKRSLDAANEELQWQATSAEALRMRLADVLRAARNEDLKTSESSTNSRHSVKAVDQLLQQWTHAGGGGGSIPLVVQQAQWLLESIRRSEAAETAATGPAPSEAPGYMAAVAPVPKAVSRDQARVRSGGGYSPERQYASS